MEITTKLISKDFDHGNVGSKPVKTINNPVYRASTILFESHLDMEMAGKGKYSGIYYGTNRLPNQRELEEQINILEQSYATRIFPSGISAIRHTLLAFLKSGDHILVCDNVYGPTKFFCKHFLPKFNITTDFIPSNADNISDYIKKETKLIFIESPGSITFEIQNIGEIVKTAKAHNIMTVIDNTWATPLFCRPISLGIDVCIESITKYISGNSDLLMGSVSVSEKYFQEFEKYYSLMGICNSSHDCYSSLKGLKTLELRLKKHEETAFFLASWLETLPEIHQVLHPALPSHKEHHLWKEYFTGSSGLFGIVFKDEFSQEQIAKFADSLSLFKMGFSWGGYKSLISTGKIKRDLKSEFHDKNIVRFSAGLEDKNDLKNDIKQAITKMKNI